MMKNVEVHSSVKDERLIRVRRDQMIKGAISLFKQKGFHRTTTREIAKASGFSIGTLYEYIEKKEDVLYLVVDRIYDEVKERLKESIDTALGTIEGLKSAIAAYFRVMNDMQDEVLVMYQEAKSLTKDALPYVLNKELQMVQMFEDILTLCVKQKEIIMSEKEIQLCAHNIFVLGQMWGFRRWALHSMVSIEDYIEMQTRLILEGLTKRENKEDEK